MSTVCYCGRPDCSVTHFARDACLTALRLERDALRAQVERVRAFCEGRVKTHWRIPDVYITATETLAALEGK